MSDLTIQILDFKTPSKSAGKFINRESVEQVLKGVEFENDLNSNRILGLFTHKDRYNLDDPNIPFADNVSTSKYLANCCRAMWIDYNTNSLIGEFDILNTEYGNLLKDNYKKGIMMPVSISVQAHADNNNYYFDRILGVDFTWNPDLESKVLTVSFSEGSKKNNNYYSFSNIVTEDNCKVHFDESYNQSNTYHMSSIKKECSEQGEEFVESRKPVKNKDLAEETKVVNLDDEKVGDEEEKELVDSLENINMEFSLDDEDVSIDDVHQDIDVEDRLSEEEILTLPNKITSSVNTINKVFSLLNSENDNSTDKINYNDNDTSSIDYYYKQIKNSEGSDEELKTLKDEFMNIFGVEFDEYDSAYKEKHKSFSLQSYMQELHMKPFQILRKRINEVIQLCRSWKQDKITKNIDYLRNYFDSYIMTFMLDSINNPTTEFNIILGLQLYRYNIEQSKLREFNRTIIRMKERMNQTGYMDKVLQGKLNAQFQAIENSIYEYINNELSKVNKNFR